MPDYDPFLLRMLQGPLNNRPVTRGAGIPDNFALMRTLNLNQPRLIPGGPPRSWYRTPNATVPKSTVTIDDYMGDTSSSAIKNIPETGRRTKNIDLSKAYRVLDNKTGEIIGTYSTKGAADAFADKKHISEGGLPSAKPDTRRYMTIKRPEYDEE